MPRPWWEEQDDFKHRDDSDEFNKKNKGGISFHEHNWDGTSIHKSKDKKVFGGVQTTEWYEMNCTCGHRMGDTDFTTTFTPNK